MTIFGISAGMIALIAFRILFWKALWALIGFGKKPLITEEYPLRPIAEMCKLSSTYLRYTGYTDCPSCGQPSSAHRVG